MTDEEESKRDGTRLQWLAKNWMDVDLDFHLRVAKGLPALRKVIDDQMIREVDLAIEGPPDPPKQSQQINSIYWPPRKLRQG